MITTKQSPTGIYWLLVRVLIIMAIGAGVYPNNPVMAEALPVIHHQLQVQLQPHRSWIQVEDQISFSSPLGSGLTVGAEQTFLLNKHLRIISHDAGVQIVRIPLDSEEKPAAENEFKYRVTFLQPATHFRVTYRGKIKHQFEEQSEGARSFSENKGIISAKGVYLAYSSAWYPLFGNELVAFELSVTLPPGWKSVSQGQRDITASGVEIWREQHPQDDIYLIAGQFHQQQEAMGGDKTLMVFLRQDEPDLAQKYIEVGAQYLQMYEQLLGAYAYQKFAVVENFWETGYGMPSFTLLGPQVIRFPFILHSSYPHEILHNWWGNGVFVDYQTGNWCEGLTAYLADHLVKEQRGEGPSYRQAALQKYTDYVAGNQDFPLTQFINRHDAVTEAVGYGKSLMFFHMMRQKLGDQRFIAGLAAFYQQHQFRKAAYSDLAAVFSDIYQSSVQAEFDQWIVRTGAPKLAVSAAKNRRSRVDGGYELSFTLQQTQLAEPYRLTIPVAVHLLGKKDAWQTVVTMDSRQQSFTLNVDAQPVKIDVDPEFDLFRRLDRYEIPPALSQAFGHQTSRFILPASVEKQAVYQVLIDAWEASKAVPAFDVQTEQEAILASDRTIWILGDDNYLQTLFADQLAAYGVEISKSQIRIGENRLVRKDHSVVLTARHPQNPDRTLVWVFSDNPAAIAGLARKLPHYGKYSYLVFEGEEPNVVVKGSWPSLNSPMMRWVEQEDGLYIKEAPAGKLQPRLALAQLPPVFSTTRMMNTIEFLASPELKGRAVGSPEIDRAADYIARKFGEMGLQPLGNQGYFQTWTEHVKELGQTVAMKNVVGVLKGSNPQLAASSILVTGHYDHLGMGQFHGHNGTTVGEIHPGADDNASGIAVLLETARVMAKGFKPERSIIFVAFSGEEVGLLGSQAYITQAEQMGYPISQIMAMINLDTVGRLAGRKLNVFGTGSASEWIHIFMGVGFTTGIGITSIAHDIGASDQRRFLGLGVPAVQFFGGTHLDYHRPTDTPEKIDQPGLIKVATVLQETIAYLGKRIEPLHAINQGGSSGEPEPGTGGTGVRLGTIPDYTYAGVGVKIDGTIPDSPAHKAGLIAGDILLKIDTHIIDQGLKSLAQILRLYQPGDQVAIGFQRGQENRQVDVTLGAK